MNSQIIEELDIVIRAKLENARKEIANFIKETKTSLSSVSKGMQDLNKNGQLNGVKKLFQNCSKECEKMKEEIRQITVNDGNVSFSFNIDKNDFDGQLENAYADYKELSDEISNDNVDVFGNVVPSLNELRSQMQSVKQEIANTEQSVYSLKDKLKDFDTLTLREQFKTIGMQVNELVPQVGQAIDGIKARFNDTTSIFGLATQKVKEFGVGFNYIKTNVLDNVKQKIDSISGTVENIKNKFSPVISIITNLGKTSKNIFTQMKANISESANTTGTPLNKIKNLISKIRSIGKESDDSKKKSSSLGIDIGNSLNKGIKSIKNFAVSLLGIRSAFSAVSKAASAYMSFDTQLNDSIQNSWNVLGSLLAPALEYVASLFSKLVSAVATFVKSLTGIDLVAKANSKSLDKQAKSAQNASNQLSGIDDIDILTTNDSSGDSTQTITVEDIDMTPFNNFFGKVKNIFSKIFEPFKLAWENIGAGVIDSIKLAFDSISALGGSVISSLFEVWTNGTGQEIIENYLLVFQNLFSIVGGLADSLNEAWNSANNGTQIIQAIANIFKAIQQFTLSIGDSLLKWVVSDGFKEALSTIISFVKDIFEYIENISKWLLEMYDKYVKPVIDDHLLPAISEIIKFIGEIWEAVKPVIEKAVQWIGEKLEPIIKELCKGLGNVIEVGKNIAQFFAGVFTGDWQKAWDGIKGIVSNVWNAIKSLFSAGGKIFEGIVDGIANVFKTIVNALISGINKVIALPFKELNKILSKIQGISIVGVKPFDWLSWRAPVPEIPPLASGDVAYEPIVAQIGEYAGARNNPEIVSPVSMMADTFRGVLHEFEDMFEGTRIDKLCVNVAGENFYDDTIDYINEKSERKGVSVIKEVS